MSCYLMEEWHKSKKYYINDLVNNYMYLQCCSGLPIDVHVLINNRLIVYLAISKIAANEMHGACIYYEGFSFFSAVHR